MPIEVRHDHLGNLNAYQQAVQGSGGGGGGGGGGAYYHINDGGDGGGGGGDAGRIERAQMATFHAAADNLQQENRQNFQMQFQERGANLEAQLSQTRLNQAEQAHYTRLQRQSSYLDENGPNGTGRFTHEEVRDMQGQINTGIDPLRRRLEASQLITQNLQQQHVTQQVAAGAAARSLNDQIAAGNFQNVVRQVPDPNRPGEFSGTYVFDGQHHTFIPSNPQQRAAAEATERGIFGGATRVGIEQEVRSRMALGLQQNGLDGYPTPNVTSQNLDQFINPADIQRQVQQELEIRAQAHARGVVPFNPARALEQAHREVHQDIQQAMRPPSPRRANETQQEYDRRVRAEQPPWMQRQGVAAGAEDLLQPIMGRVPLTREEIREAAQREISSRVQQARDEHARTFGNIPQQGPLFQNQGGQGGQAAAPAGNGPMMPHEQVQALDNLIERVAAPNRNADGIPADRVRELSAATNSAWNEHVPAVNQFLWGSSTLGSLGQRRNPLAEMTEILQKAKDDNRGLAAAEAARYGQLLRQLENEQGRRGTRLTPEIVHTFRP